MRTLCNAIGWNFLQVWPVHWRLLGLLVAGAWKPPVLGGVCQLHQLLPRHFWMFPSKGLHRRLQSTFLDHIRGLDLGDLWQRLRFLVGEGCVWVPCHYGAAVLGHRHRLDQALATDSIAVDGTRGK